MTIDLMALNSVSDVRLKSSFACWSTYRRHNKPQLKSFVHWASCLFIARACTSAIISIKLLFKATIKHVTARCQTVDAHWFKTRGCASVQPCVCIQSVIIAKVQTNCWGHWQSSAPTTTCTAAAHWPLLNSACHESGLQCFTGHSKSNPPCDQILHFKFMNICSTFFIYIRQGCSVQYIDAFCSLSERD